MIGKILIRFKNGFCYAIAITLPIQLLVMVCTGKTLMMPEYSNRFSQEAVAYGVELFLIGVMSGITSAGTVLFESKRLGVVLQSVLFLIVMLGAWIPVACFVWGFQRYAASMISTIASIVVTYGICWGIGYANCLRDVDMINRKLQEK